MRPAEPSRRRRYSFAAGVAVLLALGVLIGGPVEAGAQPVVAEMAEAKAGGRVQRFAITDPSAAKAGLFLSLVERSRNPSERELQRQVKSLQLVFQQGDPVKNATTAARQLSADLNARSLVSALDGVRTTQIMVRVYSQIFKDDKTTLADVLRQAKNTIHFPNGAKHDLPLALAANTHMFDMRTASVALREKNVWRPLAVAYEARTTGTCPFEAGPVTITQREFIVEGARDGRLLLMGALGQSTVFFLAMEQRYATAGAKPDGRPFIDVPDRPSELYEAQLGSDRLTLSGQVFKECEIVLTPQG